MRRTELARSEAGPTKSRPAPLGRHLVLVHSSDSEAPASARLQALRRDSLDDWPVCALTGWQQATQGGRVLQCVPELDAHHRMLKGSGGTSRPDRDWLPRLVTLCRRHHLWAHDQARKLAEMAGVIVRRGAYLARLDQIPVRYFLSRTRWALLTADGQAIACPPPADIPEGFAA